MDNKEVVKRMRQVADILESGEELQWRAGKSNSEWANYEDDYGHREMLIDMVLERAIEFIPVFEEEKGTEKWH